MEELPLTKAYLYIEPGPVVFVVTSDEGKHNIMSMSYHMMIEDGNRPLIGCMLGPWDYSFDTMMKTKECVLAVPTANIVTKIVDIGNCSGTDIDKFKTFGLTTMSAKTVKAPLVAECQVNLECRIHDDSLVGQYNLIILEVVHAWINSECEDRRLVHHNGNGTFRIDGETLDLKERMVKWSSYADR